MKLLTRRLEMLERSNGAAVLSPAVKAWLGQPLSVAERKALDAGEGTATAAPLDTSGMSQELKAWLGVD